MYYEFICLIKKFRIFSSILFLNFLVSVYYFYSAHLFKYVFNASCSSVCRFFTIMCHWFLASLSVRPAIFWAIWDHWLFPRLYRIKSTHSSSALHTPFFKNGFSWFFHLSRHCLPVRCSMFFAIFSHYCGPNLLICWSSIVSVISFQLFFEFLFCIIYIGLFVSICF